MTFVVVLLLALCGFSNGITDFSQKLFMHRANEIPATVFNLYSYIAATAILALVFLLVRWRYPKRQEGEATEKTSSRSLYIYVTVMAVCLVLNTYFKTLAAGKLEAGVLYPMSQGLSLIFSSPKA